MTVSPAGKRLRVTDKVIFIVVFQPEPDYVHRRQFFSSFRLVSVCK